MREISNKELLTVGDVARYMGVGQVTVRRLARGSGRSRCAVWLSEKSLGLSRVTPLPIA